MKTVQGNTFSIYNSLSRKKEEFAPLNPPFVGLYVCGPTVYGDPHLGHARPYITFDVLQRYLGFLDYKVRYVRNITDVGHLENDADSGEDKIAKKARIAQVEPMEIVQHYTNRFHAYMDALNNIPPSIEPSASGHIIEQIQMIEDILKAGFAYEAEGSVYFDVKKYHEKHHYGKLSGRILEDLMAQTRELDGQEEKQNSVDFALWKKAKPEHIMRWPSPWSDGFPGWHLECSAMSTKYLGKQFDIHGGGMDLLFPHHECEIAQSVAATNTDPAKYWVHNNMITINGQKMGKSLGNFITLEELFNGNHKLLEQAYGPMTIRFFMLQSHYRSTLDFSNDALIAAEKGLKRMLNSYQHLQLLEHPGNGKDSDLNQQILTWMADGHSHMKDDLSTPQVMASLFELSAKINSFYNKQLPLSEIEESTFKDLKEHMHLFLFDLLGLREEKGDDSQSMDGIMQLLIDLRADARTNKNFEVSDKIRDRLADLAIEIKDGKEGTTWTKQ